MGGDKSPTFPLGDESSLNNDFPEFLSESPALCREFDQVGHEISPYPVEFDANLRRRQSAYQEILRSYDDLLVRRDSLHEAKSKVLSYTPGSWIDKVGGTKLNDYAVPKTTTVLLIGPKGSGKSSLVNRISRVFEDDKFAPERAQVSYNSPTGGGTFFLQEYMIPRGSTSFCLFDARSLSDIPTENDEILQSWMTKGVHHGELVIRESDNSSLRTILKCKDEKSGSPSSETRKVNFVIFVVNGFQVLRSMNSDKEEDQQYIQLVAKTFSCPYLSFKDDKPVIVVTHGDLLSLQDRARVRIYLGEQLCVPPTKQIFDIPENFDPSTELAIVDLIRYLLEHADKSLSHKESVCWYPSFREWVMHKASTLFLLLLAVLVIALAIFMGWVLKQHLHKHHGPPPSTSATNWNLKTAVNRHDNNPHLLLADTRYPNHAANPPRKCHRSRPATPEDPRSKPMIKWHKIRHLWLDLN